MGVPLSDGHAFYPGGVDPGRADPVGADWHCFVTERVLGAFDPETPLALVATLWRLAAEGALDAVVAAVPFRGPDAVRSFVLVAIDARVTAVLRGDGVVDAMVDGRVERSRADDGAPRVADLGGVSALAIGPRARRPSATLEPAAGDLPIGSGVVRAPWLGWTAAPRGGRPDARGPDGPSAPITGSIPVQHLAIVPERTRDPITEPIAAIPVVTASIPVASTDTAVLDDVAGRVARLSRHRASIVDGRPDDPAGAGPRIRLADGSVVAVDGPVFIGRQPRSIGPSGPVLPRLVRVESPAREVSATHLELRPHDVGVLLMDLDSTNGTVVMPLGGPYRRVEPGVVVPAPPGTLVDIGDGNVIEVLPSR